MIAVTFLFFEKEQHIECILRYNLDPDAIYVLGILRGTVSKKNIDVANLKIKEMYVPQGYSTNG